MTTTFPPVNEAFKDKFGGNTALEFQGTIAGVSHDDRLTVAKTNELCSVTNRTDNTFGKSKAITCTVLFAADKC